MQPSKTKYLSVRADFRTDRQCWKGGVLSWEFISERLWNDDDGQKQWRTAFSIARTGCCNYAVLKTADIAGLSTSDKQSIIQSLQGFCVQDLDWDTLVGSFPEPIRQQVPGIFAEAILVKSVVGRFFDKPFWYFDYTPEGCSVPLVEPLQYLYERFKKTNDDSARLWRSETTRLATSADLSQVPDTELGLYTKKEREAGISQLAVYMLSESPLHLLLNEETEYRTNELIEFICYAEELATRLSTTAADLRYRNLTELPPLFTRATEFIQAYHEHNLDLTDPRLDGRRILLLIHPAAVCVVNKDRMEECRMAKAEAVVEHREWTIQDNDRILAENEQKGDARDKVQEEKRYKEMALKDEWNRQQQEEIEKDFVVIIEHGLQ
ncbi:hypothetical protein BO70DRAFT_393684 [Aspergillus heteromorphus CBS 117.55]|uniref:Uncharacterized protein n=1 Tax=Aspergillus heteromorphus CBS 117.55 TaxID=1448321 RepID=A0A317WRU3_9EURO|nr:uncharacterized protein BO70DRAFT_393684 [Aspergillus heteromorphus CBS 117.55]PWY89174.1 hypothetical protein BO70DRAFT_393684 [Aspergillus heteromorphus CBS 117.55]